MKFQLHLPRKLWTIAIIYMLCFFYYFFHLLTTQSKERLSSRLKTTSNYSLAMNSKKIQIIVKSKQYKTYICHDYQKASGRLGNQMFQYASLYGIAKSHGYNLAITKNENHIVLKSFKKIFTIHISSEERLRICNKTKVLDTPRAAKFYDLPLNNTNVTINGYLSSWKYFKCCEEDIKKQFSFPESVMKEANMILKLLKNNNNSIVTVGIHVRRGDYKENGGVFAPKTYFDAVKSYFRKSYHNVIFVVSTNPNNSSRNWCLKNIVKGQKDTFLLPKQSALLDLGILTICNHMVMTMGTYGWWAAFLNNGTKVYYDYYPITHPHIVKNDFIYPGWIGISKNPSKQTQTDVTG